MFDSSRSLVKGAHRLVASLDASTLTGVQAAALVRDFAELERLAVAGRTVLARRVEETGAWASGGHRSAAEWMAAQTGSTVGAAKDALNTSNNLPSQPQLDEALRNGELSAEKAAAVSDAAKKDPQAESDLVDTAKKSSLGVTRDECNKAKARAEDPAARAERCRKNRRAFFIAERDGMGGLMGTGPVGAMALIRAALEKRTDQIFRQRNRAGAEQEPRDRYMFDALVELITGGNDSSAKRSTTRVNAQIRVDLTALRRRFAEAGEICDAPGVGELTVDEVELLLAQKDTLIDIVVTRGHDVIRTARIDRYLPAEQQRALKLRDPCCVIPGCNVTYGLEIDHLDGYAATKLTSVERLARLCRHHHMLKTRYGWILTRRPDGTYSFEAPNASVEHRSRTG